MDLNTLYVLCGAMLVALVLIFIMLARVFSRLNKQGEGMVSLSVPVSAEPVTAAPVRPAPVSSGVAPEIVAAITAAVFSMDGGSSVVASVRPLRAARANVRGAWGFAGRQSDTLPF